MIVNFKDKAVENLFNGEHTKAARKRCPSSLWKIASRKLDLLDSVQRQRLDELKVPPGNRLEALSGDRLGQHSIRFNELVNKKRGVTPSTALRLARFFGVSADFWMNLQMRWDLYKAEQLEHDDLSSIQEVTHWQKMA